MESGDFARQWTLLFPEDPLTPLQVFFFLFITLTPRVE